MNEFIISPTVTSLDPKMVKANLEEFRQGWIEATSGEMSEVTLNLELLFNDLFEMFGIPAPTQLGE